MEKHTDIRGIDLADFTEPEYGKNVTRPLCPARWVMPSRVGLCNGCPMKGSNGTLANMCGLPHMTVDHPYRVIDKRDGKTRHFIAYPYHTNLKDMEAIVKLCKAHPGLQVDIRSVADGHGRSYRLDFYYSESLAMEGNAESGDNQKSGGGSTLYAAICECYCASQHEDGFKPYIFWRSPRTVGESDLLGMYDTQKTANNELVKHARQIVDKMNRNARKFGIDHASFEEHSPGYVEVFAEYEHEDRVIWSSAYKLRVYARDFNKLIPEDIDKERPNAERV